MKRIIALCCTSLSLLGQAQTAQVHIAGSDYPTEFADAKLSLTNQQRVASDLTVALSHISSFEVTKGREVESGVFRLKRALIFTMSESEDVLVIDQNNQKSIRISKTLSDKYLQAFAWMDTHTNAVQKAHAFVTMLNSTNLLVQPVQVLRNLGHAKPLSDIDENNPPDGEVLEFFRDDIQPNKFPGFSALNFYFKPIPEIDNMEIPLLLLFRFNKSTPSDIFAYPIGFYKGKWGFGNFPDPD